MAAPQEVNIEIVRELIGRVEGNRHDFKRSLDLRKRGALIDLAKDIMAFANQHDPRDSYILVGVTNDRQVAGSDGLGIDEAELRQTLSSFYDRKIEWRLERLQLDGLTIEVIAIGQADVRPVRFLKNESWYAGGNAKVAWSEGECFIRDGSSKRPWKGIDDDELRRRHLPVIDVQWLVRSERSSHVYVSWPNADNEVRFEPKPPPTGIRLRLQQAILSAGERRDPKSDEGEAAGQKVPENPEVHMIGSELARLASIQDILESVAHKQPMPRGWGGAPERTPSEVDIDVQVSNKGQAKSGELHLTLFAPEGLLFVPYWDEMALLGRSKPLDFRTADDGSEEVSLTRDSLLHGLTADAKVRLRFDGPGEYLIPYSCAVEFLPGAVEGVLRLTVELQHCQGQTCQPSN